MKKLYVCMLVGICVLAFAGCGNTENDIADGKNDFSVSAGTIDVVDPMEKLDLLSTSKDESDTLDAEAANYTIMYSSDYQATELEDLYELADVVLKGTFVRDTDTYLSSGNLPVTRSLFTVDRVYKGAYDGEEIAVEYYGGAVSLAEYVAALSPAQITKMGIDTTKAVTGTVTLQTTQESVMVESNETYVLFLSYDPNKDIYFVLCDGYGMCKMDGDAMYSLSAQEFVNLDFMTAE